VRGAKIDRASFHSGTEKSSKSYGDLDSLFKQFFALVEAAVRVPPGSEQRAAFRKVRDCGACIDQIAVKLLNQDQI
jgi:hypothetical protein